MPAYVYELRRHDEVVAADERKLTVGDEVEIGEWVGIVREAIPAPAENEVRLVVQVQSRNFG